MEESSKSVTAISCRSRQGGRTLIVYHGDEAFSILDLQLVTELEFQPSAESRESDTRNGDAGP